MVGSLFLSFLSLDHYELSFKSRQFVEKDEQIALLFSTPKLPLKSSLTKAKEKLRKLLRVCRTECVQARKQFQVILKMSIQNFQKKKHRGQKEKLVSHLK